MARIDDIIAARAPRTIGRPAADENGSRGEDEK
jgi:hypothetical protein